MDVFDAHPVVAIDFLKEQLSVKVVVMDMDCCCVSVVCISFACIGLTMSYCEYLQGVELAAVQSQLQSVRAVLNAMPVPGYHSTLPSC